MMKNKTIKISHLIKGIKKKRGATLTGYGLVVGLIAVISIASIGNVGNAVKTLFGKVSNDLEAVTTTTAPQDTSPPTYGWVNIGTETRDMRFSNCSSSSTILWTCTATSSGAYSGTAGPGDQITINGTTISGRVSSFHGFSSPVNASTVYEGLGITGFVSGEDTVTIEFGSSCSSDTEENVTATVYECQEL